MQRDCQQPGAVMDARPVLTFLGRRALAVDALFGYPWPNAAGQQTWRDPHQKPLTLCGRVWTCGNPTHHRNCNACEAHCPFGSTAEQHEAADPSPAVRRLPVLRPVTVAQPVDDLDDDTWDA